MTGARTSDNYCYRHPKRQSFVLCQRCARTICADCQTAASVGVICPECLKSQRATAPKVKPRWRTALASSSRPLLTYAIIAVCVVVFILQRLPGIGASVTDSLLYAGLYSAPQLFEPWRMFTVVLVHGGFLHIGFNMLTLWSFGAQLEGLLGRTRYFVLFLLSALGGSLGVLYLMPPGQGVVGASGAIFGMAAAYLVIAHRLGARTTGLIVLLAGNLVAGFFFGWAWQAHLGGLVIGGIIGFVFMETRTRARARAQWWLLAALAAVLVLLSFRYFFAPLV